MNIPTAEEFFKQCFEGYHTSQYNELHEVQKTRAEFAIIEFAKLHVEAAKQEITKKARTKSDWSGNTGSEYCDTVVDKDSILNAYPLTNIK
jgi:hypothetical protein